MLQCFSTLPAVDGMGGCRQREDEDQALLPPQPAPLVSPDTCAGLSGSPSVTWGLHKATGAAGQRQHRAQDVRQSTAPR